MKNIIPCVDKIHTNKVCKTMNQTFFNFPINQTRVTSFKQTSFIINNCKILSIEFNDSSFRWCYYNDEQRQTDFVKLLQNTNVKMDIDLS